MADHSFHKWSKYGIKKSHSVLYTLWLIIPKYRIFSQTRVRFTQKGKIGRLHLFFALQNRFLKKRGNWRKTRKTQENLRFSGCIFFVRTTCVRTIKKIFCVFCDRIWTYALYQCIIDIKQHLLFQIISNYFLIFTYKKNPIVEPLFCHR